MNASEFFKTGRNLTPGQRWLFHNGRLSYLAEICPTVSWFKVLTVIVPDTDNFSWVAPGAVHEHTSLTERGSCWTYLDGQEAPK